jgi:hypothetical protein
MIFFTVFVVTGYLLSKKNGEKIDAIVALKDTNNDIAILKLSQSPTSR